jgi:2-polyprenyl-3-methyl-5-hydroxy-6-metoxy-1,4-benzoquinol methylase
MRPFTNIVTMIKAEMPWHSKNLERAMRVVEDADVLAADDYITYLLRNHDLDFLVASYRTIVDDANTEQLEFRRTHRYRHSTFAAVAGSVYFDQDYMTRYMVGLGLSYFLWPNQIQIRRFFRQTLPRLSGGKYLEIGPGHGMFLLQALQQSSYDRFLGVDISPSSIALTQDVVRTIGQAKANELDLLQMDFLAADTLDGPYEAIVMGEVLEHVEQPGEFLRRIGDLAAKESHIFITTCVNTPAVDHIYHFRTVDDVENLIMESGLSIRQAEVVPYPGQKLATCIAEELPINVAYVLGK